MAISLEAESSEPEPSADPELNDRGRLPAPRALYNIPVAKSFAEIGRFVTGADLN